jgi:ABC-type Fe3+/spermidine/putrescine transport system ATPase subunit
MEGAAKRYPSQLSGGQQQRIAIARSIIFNPPVLLMDEPLGALDRKLRARLQIELRELQRRLGITVVYVTHDQEEALALSDRIAVMREGRIEQIGNGKELYESPASEFVAGFLGENNVLSGVVTATTQKGSTVRLSNGCELSVCNVSGSAGRPVALTIRPERLVIVHEAKATLSGVVRDIIYLGSIVRCSIECAGGQSLVSIKSNDGAWAAPRIGQRVGLTWAQSDLKIFDQVG